MPASEPLWNSASSFTGKPYDFVRAFKSVQYLLCVFSLDPDEDPLCMLLIIDYLALRSKQYDYLIDFYHVLEVSVSFCFSHFDPGIEHC